MSQKPTRRELAALLLGAAELNATPYHTPGMHDMLWELLLEHIQYFAEIRQRLLASTESLKSIEAFQTRVRTSLTDMLGPLPEITTLNPNHVDSLQRDDYVVEKVIYESRPRFQVSTNLYRPKYIDSPLPSVVLLPGHIQEGKAHETHQRFCILLARLGFMVLTWDSVGTGERRRHLGKIRNLSNSQSLREQEIVGRQCYLLGLNLLQYRLWDALRAVDYLSARSEVDSRRIAITGYDDTAMEALFLACLDRRINVTVSLSTGMSFRHRAENLFTPNPEKIFFRSFELGIDYPEILVGIAPRPLLFGGRIQNPNARSSNLTDFQHVAKIYKSLDVVDRFKVTPPAKQLGLTRQQRELAARWLVRWLGNRTQMISEKPAVIATEQDLKCTPLVTTESLAKSETVSRLNQAYAEKITPQRKQLTDQIEYEAYRNEIVHNIRKINRIGAPRRESGVFLPDRVFDVGAFARGVAVVVADIGKDDPYVRRALIDPLIASGYRVIALDLRGWGETTPTPPRDGFTFSWNDFLAYRSLEIGKPLMGQRVKDLLAVSARRTNRREWLVAGVGEGALVAAQAAVLEPRIKAVISIGGLLSFRSLLDDASPKQPFSSFLPGIIGAYEMHDVYAAIAPRRLLIVNPQDSQKKVLEAGTAKRELQWVTQVFETVGSRTAFSLRSQISPRKMHTLLTEWLAKI